MTDATPLLEVSGLTKQFPLVGGQFAKQRGVVHAVNGVSFSIEAGTTLALVGESGCGKSTTANMILLLERPTSGEIRFNGADLSRQSKAGLREYRRSVQAVFQDPFSSLSPRMRVWDLISEPLRIHRLFRGKALNARVAELMEQVGLSSRAASYYPHEFSGGQRQRIAIARALALSPKLVVLDEPVSALDVSIRAQILNLLSDLQEHLGLSYLLISHDLAIVTHMSHRIAVMYGGRIVEIATKEELSANAVHPFTRALIAAVPDPDPAKRLNLTLGGEVANPVDPPTGCTFHPRCPLRHELGDPAMCVESEPPLLGDSHQTACHFRDVHAPA